MTRTLVLRREALTELSTEDLGGVGGGYDPSVVATACVTGCVPDDALSRLITQTTQVTVVVTRQTCDPRWCYTFPYC